MGARNISRWIALGVTLFLLSACGETTPPVGRREPPVKLEEIPTAQKEVFAATFPLFDGRTGREEAPLGPDGRAPFGVLLNFLNRQELGICTLTHFAPGRLLTNAHCVARDSRLHAYYVVFYDRDGRHASAPVEKFLFVGDPRGQDAAVLQVSERVTAQWDTLATTVTSTRAFKDRALGQGNFPTTVWAFDPIQRHPRLDPLGTRRGAVFLPRQCTGFRSQPKVDIFTSEFASLPYPWTPTDTAVHFFLDHCTRPLVGGNSGALITQGTDTQAALGVFHWLVTIRDREVLSRIQRYRYVGSRGTSESIRPGPDVSLYNVGTDLEALRARHAGAL